MKIGTMTLFNTTNHGAMLQNFALQHALQAFGAQTSLINYKYYNKDALCVKNLIKLSSIKAAAVSAINISNIAQYVKRLGVTTAFQKQYLSPTTVVTNAAEIAKLDYDGIVFGSDQIWNKNIVGSLDPNFFFAQGKNKNLVYGASVGEIDDFILEKDKIVGYCEKSGEITVRERQVADVLRGFGIKCDTVIDPTLLLKKGDYERAFGLTQVNKKPFVLVYSLARNKSLIKRAKAIAKEKGLKIKIFANTTKKPFDFKTNLAASPIDFLNVIKNADFIITDSFHGTAFSIIFEKEFLIYNSSKRNGRLSSLMDVLEIKGRLNCEGDFDEIDYEKVGKILEKEAERSNKYLREICNE